LMSFDVGGWVVLDGSKIISVGSRKILRQSSV
jgi:hypothetical protein